jgi:hypothetical protein
MKKIFRAIFVVILFLITPIFMSNVFADLPPDPGSGGPGGGDLPVGGGSPIGGGIVMMMIMGAAYGSKKVFDARKKILD